MSSPFDYDPRINKTTTHGFGQKLTHTSEAFIKSQQQATLNKKKESSTSEPQNEAQKQYESNKTSWATHFEVEESFNISQTISTLISDNIKHFTGCIVYCDKTEAPSLKTCLENKKLGFEKIESSFYLQQMLNNKKTRIFIITSDASQNLSSNYSIPNDINFVIFDRLPESYYYDALIRKIENKKFRYEGAVVHLTSQTDKDRLRSIEIKKNLKITFMRNEPIEIIAQTFKIINLEEKYELPVQEANKEHHLQSDKKEDKYKTKTNPDSSIYETADAHTLEWATHILIEIDNKSGIVYWEKEFVKKNLKNFNSCFIYSKDNEPRNSPIKNFYEFGRKHETIKYKHDFDNAVQRIEENESLILLVPQSLKHDPNYTIPNNVDFVLNWGIPTYDEYMLRCSKICDSKVKRGVIVCVTDSQEINNEQQELNKIVKGENIKFIKLKLNSNETFDFSRYKCEGLLSKSSSDRNTVDSCQTEKIENDSSSDLKEENKINSLSGQKQLIKTNSSKIKESEEQANVNKLNNEKGKQPNTDIIEIPITKEQLDKKIESVVLSLKEEYTKGNEQIGVKIKENSEATLKNFLECNRSSKKDYENVFIKIKEECAKETSKIAKSYEKALQELNVKNMNDQMKYEEKLQELTNDLELNKKENKKTIKNFQTEIENNQNQLLNENKKLKQTYLAYELSQKELNKRVKELEDENEKWKSNYESVETSCLEIDTENNSLKDQVKELKTKLTEFEKSHQILKANLAKSEKSHQIEIANNNQLNQELLSGKQTIIALFEEEEFSKTKDRAQPGDFESFIKNLRQNNLQEILNISADEVKKGWKVRNSLREFDIFEGKNEEKLMNEEHVLNEKMSSFEKCLKSIEPNSKTSFVKICRELVEIIKTKKTDIERKNKEKVRLEEKVKNVKDGFCDLWKSGKELKIEFKNDEGIESILSELCQLFKMAFANLIEKKNSLKQTKAELDNLNVQHENLKTEHASLKKEFSNEKETTQELTSKLNSSLETNKKILHEKLTVEKNSELARAKAQKDISELEQKKKMSEAKLSDEIQEKLREIEKVRGEKEGLTKELEHTKEEAEHDIEMKDKEISELEEEIALFKSEKSKKEQSIKTFEERLNQTLDRELQTTEPITLANYEKTLVQIPLHKSKLLFMPESILFNELNLQEKNFIINSIKDVVPKKIKNTRTLFEGYKDASFDKWQTKIEDNKNIVVLIKLLNGHIIGGFSEDPYSTEIKGQGKGFMMSVTNHNIYNIKEKYEGKVLKRDEYFFVFGNDELIIKYKDRRPAYSVTFAMTNLYFETIGKDIKGFLGTDKDEDFCERVEFHQVIFE